MGAPFALLAERRTVSPYIVSPCPWVASQTRFVHSMKRFGKLRASMREKTRPKASYEGIPLGEFVERLEPLDFGVSEGFDIDPVVGACDDGADGRPR